MTARELRYERKVPVSGLHYRDVEEMILLHPSCFREIFWERQVNNIYFDNPEYESLSDNLCGKDLRVKSRIRWYGDDPAVFEAVLEFKIKNGLAGYKKSFPLGKTRIDDILRPESLYRLLSGIRGAEGEYMKGRTPLLVNSYKRKYYLSFDKKFRMTLDRDITSARCGFIQPPPDKRECVIEIKYSVNDDGEAAAVIDRFPFRIDKHSKYVNGIFRPGF